MLNLQGVTERYQVDFAGVLIIIALVAWLWCADRLRSSGWARPDRSGRRGSRRSRTGRS